jgi:hypothetical protein
MGAILTALLCRDVFRDLHVLTLAMFIPAVSLWRVMAGFKLSAVVVKTSVVCERPRFQHCDIAVTVCVRVSDWHHDRIIVSRAW